MDVESLVRTAPPRRLQVSYLRWGAVFAGTIVGLSVFLLLALLGVAAGLTVVGAEQPDLGAVPPMTGAWTVISMLIAVWLGGNVAGRLSGLARRSDGVLHGFVVWATVTLLLAWLMSTAMGAVFGGAFAVFGQELAELGQTGPAGQVDGAGISERLDALSTTFWWLFAGLLLSLGLGLWGGAVGVRVTADRSTGEHEDQRKLRA
ncbi:hypothetical protein SAMN03097708_01527 [Thiohalomonas denitrificans]|uniref:Uncharacterized protein n=2 Tax=Thiohalomonas denitrificans TaxID=415747 RepID=A0A1G5Q7P7_9GAMM|nr:hypothetical protein SAMN03097708_01527 [Thiohalomonas denitrificans]